ncbi:major capsid protein [Capnocytophaga canimorsus]|uniref:major capsid protein n=1 Tax=Capnocytophaga canimorsus TaxID=28188 RepID=UPI0037CD3BC8
MLRTLMQGLNEKDMQAVIHTYNLKDYYYPTLFPLKETNSLTWKMLEAQTGLKIAADLVSRGATIPKKTREAISRIQGDIPKIAISREKLEDELTEYDIMVAMASNNSDLRALVEFWAEDTKFCWDGVAARAEWIALQQISLGKVKFTNSNNAAIVTEYDVDYQIPATQKIGVKTAYTTGVKGNPFTVDIPKAIKLGKEIGAIYKFAFMTPETFEKLASQEEVVKRLASLYQNTIGIQETPTLEAVNAYLSKKSQSFKGLQFVLIDQNIAIELADGTRVVGNPFEEDVILFSESKELGKTWWKTPIDAKKMPGSVAEKVMHGHTLIKKYSEESPVKEVTEGIANLFPAWNLAGRSVLMQVNNTSWDKN